MHCISREIVFQGIRLEVVKGFRREEGGEVGLRVAVGNRRGGRLYQALLDLHHLQRPVGRNQVFVDVFVEVRRNAVQPFHRLLGIAELFGFGQPDDFFGMPESQLAPYVPEDRAARAVGNGAAQAADIGLYFGQLQFERYGIVHRGRAPDDFVPGFGNPAKHPRQRAHAEIPNQVGGKLGDAELVGVVFIEPCFTLLTGGGPVGQGVATLHDCGVGEAAGNTVSRQGFEPGTADPFPGNIAGTGAGGKRTYGGDAVDDGCAPVFIPRKSFRVVGLFTLALSVDKALSEEVPAVVQYDFAVIGGGRGTGGFAGGNLFGNLFFGDAEHAGVDVIGYCRWGGRFFSALKSRFDGIY